MMFQTAVHDPKQQQATVKVPCIRLSLDLLFLLEPHNAVRPQRILVYSSECLLRNSAWSCLAQQQLVTSARTTDGATKHEVQRCSKGREPLLPLLAAGATGTTHYFTSCPPPNGPARPASHFPRRCRCHYCRRRPRCFVLPGVP
jgi:hypothetical protein